MKRNHLLLAIFLFYGLTISCTNEKKAETDSSTEQKTNTGYSEETGNKTFEKRQYYYSISDLPETMLIPEKNIKTRFLLEDEIQLSFIEVPANTTFPVHGHDAAQILVVLEGEEHHEINGEKFVMHAGDVAVHPSGIPHGGTAGPNGFKGIDIFYPPRASHVQLMKEQGTLPNEFKEYSKGN